VAGSFTVEGLASAAGLDAMHDVVRRVAAAHPALGRAGFALFETAVIEIANNVVEHSGTAGGVRWRLEVRVRGDVIEAELTDDGPPFTPDLAAPMPGPAAESGRGVAMARAVLDRCEVVRDGDRNRWTLAKRLGG
jgi:serine/threonine-protein kinase RsbW